MVPPKMLFVAPNSKMSYETLPPDYKIIFSRFIGFLKFIGFDIFGADWGRSNVNASVRLFIFCIDYIPFCVLTYSLVFNLDQFENFLDAAAIFPTVIVNTLDLIKMVAAILMKNEVKELMLAIGELWPKRLGHGEKDKVMTSWLRKLNLVIKTYFVYVTIVMVNFFSLPMILTVYNMHTGVNEYLFPMKPGPWTVNSTSVYLATYAWEITLMVCHVCLYHAYDIIVVINTLNISVLLRILQIDLKDVIQASCATRKNTKVLDEDFDEVKKVVIAHQKILSIVDKNNECFGMVVFTHTSLSSLLICFFFFMTVAFNDMVRTIANTMVSVDMAITVFLLAVAGQLLYDTSTGVADAAYDSVWYESDLKVQKLVVLVIARSQQPCYLNALNFSTMTLPTFSKIMSSAWTYLSLLTQMYER